ncbi:MAG TPA: S1/P1 Nuclease [Caulobacteraceae bacterium]
MPAAALAAMIAVAAPHPTLAWGATGHRLIARLAIANLPVELPLFLRGAETIAAEGELAREPDRWKGAGRIHDNSRDPAHFVDLDDNGAVLGGPSLADLPPTREAYDQALRATGSDSWKAGWLPYAIVDGWQQLAKDFAYWRVESTAIKGVANSAHRVWMVADLKRREALILDDLGALAHYVGDGSQPMHVSVHFNGWGDGPNPEGFTQNRIHAYFEGAFVHDYIDEADVARRLAPYEACRCGIEARTVAYLRSTNRQITPLFRLQKAGAFRLATADGKRFVAERLAAGADALRDDIVDAWRASAFQGVGYPAVKLADVEQRGLDPYDALYGTD